MSLKNGPFCSPALLLLPRDYLSGVKTRADIPTVIQVCDAAAKGLCLQSFLGFEPLIKDGALPFIETVKLKYKLEDFKTDTYCMMTKIRMLH